MIMNMCSEYKQYERIQNNNNKKPTKLSVRLAPLFPIPPIPFPSPLNSTVNSFTHAFPKCIVTDINIEIEIELSKETTY